jgi:hypothetical protein
MDDTRSSVTAFGHFPRAGRRPSCRCRPDGSTSWRVDIAETERYHLGVNCYRSMTPEDDGYPKVSASARGLGVRLSDVTLDPEGRVVPRKGGMSIAPESLWNLPNHRRPRTMGNGSTGPDADHVFCILSSAFHRHNLVLRLDSKVHGLVEPIEPLRLTVFEAALARTRAEWRCVWPQR